MEYVLGGSTAFIAAFGITAVLRLRLPRLTRFAFVAALSLGLVLGLGFVFCFFWFYDAAAWFPLVVEALKPLRSVPLTTLSAIAFAVVGVVLGALLTRRRP